MCYNYDADAEPDRLSERFSTRFTKHDKYIPQNYNGFTHPFAPVITNKIPDDIQLYQWGLMPHWAKDNSFQKNTLNARIETIHDKPSFRSYTENRCLVIATGFYEWKWLDPKGKQKQKHRIWESGTGIFAFAGLYSHWLDKTTGELIPTFTIITREAEGIMREIHNSKLRMPAVLLPEEESAWLSGEIEIPTAPELEAEEV